MAVQYTSIRGSDEQTRRQVKALVSTPARESLNAKLSWQKLMLLLAANFKSSDLVVTLTYREDALPRNRDEAAKRIRYFIRLLRSRRQLDGVGLKYAYTTEGYHTHGRLHHHLIINSTGQDFDVIRDLWRRWGDNVDFERFGWDGPERWGKYLTKEPREQGRRRIGERSWCVSRNMVRVKPHVEFVPAGEPLLPPAGAKIVDRAQCDNCYGRFCYMMAYLPEELG